MSDIPPLGGSRRRLNWSPFKIKVTTSEVNSLIAMLIGTMMELKRQQRGEDFVIPDLVKDTLMRWAEKIGTDDLVALDLAHLEGGTE